MRFSINFFRQSTPLNIFKISSHGPFKSAVIIENIVNYLIQSKKELIEWLAE
jgi:hypothetical protein